ncbi:MAG: hypothetical protein ACRD2U_03660 [Terriglobales bacterium]
MKISNIPRAFAIAIALLLTASAFASNNKGLVQVSTTVTVNGKLLAAGEYVVMWDGTGPNVQVSFVKGKKVMATAPAHVIDLNSSPAADSVVINRNDDGSNSLAEIRFGGKKKALSLEETTPQS